MPNLLEILTIIEVVTARDPQAVMFAADTTNASKWFRIQKGNLNLGYPVKIEPKLLFECNGIPHFDRIQVTYWLPDASTNFVIDMLTTQQVAELLQSFVTQIFHEKSVEHFTFTLMSKLHGFFEAESATDMLRKINTAREVADRE